MFRMPRRSSPAQKRRRAMKTQFVLAAVLSVTVAAVAVSDYSAARDNYRRNEAVLSDANDASPGGRDAARAESNLPSPGGHDAALADAEGNGRTPGGRDSAQG